MVNYSVSDPFDVGDGTVIGGIYFKGFHVDENRLILKLDPTFGTTMSDFTSMVFDDTLILKPLNKSSFSTVWNEGTYTASGLEVNISTAVIPEPATLGLFSFVSLLFFAIRRRFLY